MQPSEVFFPFHNQLVTQIIDSGLSFYSDGMFKKITGSEIYDRDVIYATLPLADNLLLLSRKNGIMLFDGEQLRLFETDAADYVNENRIYRAVSTGQNRIAIATLDGGIVMMDLDGKGYEIITEDQGLPTNIIYDLYLDSEETLWALTDNGIAKLLVNNPVTAWGEQAGYSGATLFVGQIGDTIYSGGTEGLFEMIPGGRVNGSTLIAARIYGGIETESGYMVSSPEGLFTIDDEGVQEVSGKHYLQLSGDVKIPDQY